MSYRLPKYREVVNCTLPPWGSHKLKKFADKSTAGRMARIKNCNPSIKGTANSSFKGTGMGSGSAAGFSEVQSSSSRTTTLAATTCRCGNSQSN